MEQKAQEGIRRIKRYSQTTLHEKCVQIIVLTQMFMKNSIIIHIIKFVRKFRHAMKSLNDLQNFAFSTNFLAMSPILSTVLLNLYISISIGTYSLAA